MSYIHPAALAARRKYWTRPDAYRFAAPGTPEAEMPGWLDPSMTRVRWKEAREAEARAQVAAAQEEFEREFAQLRWEVKKLKLEHELWCFEQKYSPNQPRVPAGSPQGGRWTSGASAVGDAAAVESAESDASANSIGSGAQANVIPICLLGTHSISTDRFGNRSWWADYVCADGFTFRRFGTGGNIRGFRVDPR